MHTCHLLGPPRSRLNVRDTLAQWSARRDRITAKLECAAMIYRVVTWGRPGLGTGFDPPRPLLVSKDERDRWRGRRNRGRWHVECDLRVSEW